MYYHEISLLPQLRFLLYSVFSGIIDGFICIFLCNPLFTKKARFITDFVFAIICSFTIVFTNIVYQEAALRFYELLGFFFGMILIIITLKQRSDKFFIRRKSFFEKIIVKPINNKCKFIINKAKLVLKKTTSMLYNLFNRMFINSKENKVGNGRKKETKKE